MVCEEKPISSDESDEEYEALDALADYSAYSRPKCHEESWDYPKCGEICIHRNNWEQHLHHLELVFERLRIYNLTCSVEKCRFGMERLEYLGFQVSSTAEELLETKYHFYEAFDYAARKFEIHHGYEIKRGDAADFEVLWKTAAAYMKGLEMIFVRGYFTGGSSPEHRDGRDPDQSDTSSPEDDLDEKREEDKVEKKEEDEVETVCEDGEWAEIVSVKCSKKKKKNETDERIPLWSSGTSVFGRVSRRLSAMLRKRAIEVNSWNVECFSYGLGCYRWCKKDLWALVPRRIKIPYKFFGAFDGKKRMIKSPSPVLANESDLNGNQNLKYSRNDVDVHVTWK
ncbi:unnamed protein product [Trichogramma brassicae]|uniref:Uncharacterized protein n=1 Tax=Trichogramma brassicae TaxID=86971 RepID=A0A6H5IKE4_9HYME|nr:unnamed protein product [Trichogramma brassicae]